jgi:hypothetical protein
VADVIATPIEVEQTAPIAGEAAADEQACDDACLTPAAVADVKADLIGATSLN